MLALLTVRPVRLMQVTEHAVKQHLRQALAQARQRLITAQQATDQVPAIQDQPIPAALSTVHLAQKTPATVHVCRLAAQAMALVQHIAEATSRSIAATRSQEAIHQQRQHHLMFTCLFANKLPI